MKTIFLIPLMASLCFPQVNANAQQIDLKLIEQKLKSLNDKSD